MNILRLRCPQLLLLSILRLGYIYVFVSGFIVGSLWNSEDNYWNSYKELPPGMVMVMVGDDNGDGDGGDNDGGDDGGDNGW